MNIYNSLTSSTSTLLSLPMLCSDTHTTPTRRSSSCSGDSQAGTPSMQYMYISPDGARYFSVAEVQGVLSMNDDMESLLEGEGKSNESLKSSHIFQVTPKVHLEATAFQIVDVIHSLPETEDWMIKKVRDVLHGKKEGEDSSASMKKRRQESLSQCEKMVESFVEMLLQAEEKNSKIVNKLKRMSLKDFVVGLIVTIAVFCKAHPPLLLPHLHTLLPYLKCDNGLDPKQESLVCLKIVEILSSLVSWSLPQKCCVFVVLAHIRIICYFRF